MLWLEVVRYAYGDDSTLGKLYLSGVPDLAFECFTLEDERREVKVKGETCIPRGMYEVKLRHDSPKYKHFDERWPWHKGMLWLQNVPGFEYIYIHPGNTDDDTEGCLLVGKSGAMLPDGEFQLMQSREAYQALYRKVMLAMDAGEKVMCNVRER